MSPKIEKKIYRLVKTTPKGIIITRAELHALLILSISSETSHTVLLISYPFSDY